MSEDMNQMVEQWNEEMDRKDLLLKWMASREAANNEYIEERLLESGKNSFVHHQMKFFARGENSAMGIVKRYLERELELVIDPSELPGSD